MQPHPDPNYAPHAAARLLAVAWRTSAWNATRFGLRHRELPDPLVASWLSRLHNAFLVFSYLLVVKNEAFAHTPSLVAHPQLCILSIPLSHQRLYTYNVCGSNSYRQSISMCGYWSQLLRLMKSFSRQRTTYQLINFLVGPQSCYIIRLTRVY